MQLLFTVDAEQPLVIDLMALTPEKHMQPPMAESASNRGQFLQPRSQHRGILQKPITR